MHRVIVRASLIFFTVTVLGLALVFGWGLSRFDAPREVAGDAPDIIVFLPRGMPLVEVAQTLHRTGAVEDPKLFEWGVRLFGNPLRLRAGEYAIPSTTSMRGVMALLSSGKTLLHSVTIPEGLTVAEIVKLLARVDGLSGDVIELPPEGSLLPETYKYTRGDQRKHMVKRMQAAMTDTVARLWQTRKPGLPFNTPDEMIVLASLIEKETAIPEERPTIAGVFVNRLRRQMRLQSDPTVVYALTKGAGSLGRALTVKDLETTSLFNTYMVRGLPPGPITNPGRASIAAAAKPATTDAYYFVADGTGGHKFAKSLAEHQQNVKQWRSLKRQQRKHE